MDRKCIEEERWYRIIHYASIAQTAIMALNAVYNLALSGPLGITTTILIDVERLILSTFIIILILLEFHPKT